MKKQGSTDPEPALVRGLQVSIPVLSELARREVSPQHAVPAWNKNKMVTGTSPPDTTMKGGHFGPVS